MSALPIGLIKGYKGAKEEMEVVQNKRQEIQRRREKLKEKVILCVLNLTNRHTLFKMKDWYTETVIHLFPILVVFHV